PWVKRMLDMMGFKDDEAIENRMISRRIEGAQKKIEEKNFEIRKNLLEYDEVMDEQRKRIYTYRQNILDGANCRELILDMINDRIDSNLNSYFDRHFSAEFFSSWASRELNTPPLDFKMFRGLSADSATVEAKDAAKRAAESDIFGKIEENLPQGSGDEEEDIQRDWNWEAISRFSNSRFSTHYRDRDLKKIGYDNLAEKLIADAHQHIDSVNLEDAKEILKDDFGAQRAIQWFAANFDIRIDSSEIRNLETEEIKTIFVEKAIEKYNEKEAEYPVMAGIVQFATTANSIDREGLITWAAERFNANVSPEDIRNKQRDELKEMLIQISQKHQRLARDTHQELETQLRQLESAAEFPLSNSNGAMASLSSWLQKEVDYEIENNELNDLDLDELTQRLTGVVDDFFHPEMRRMERIVLLSIVDNAWKDHLLQMDYLRSAVGQRGLAAIDPKVEYKREGMRMFEELWTSIGEQTTDLIFKMEQLDDDFVSETWVGASASQADAQSLSTVPQDSEQTNAQSDAKLEPIRNVTQKVGRNDPCPCGSGKKFKHCCLRK
ncbi:MAG: SEC-C metal-binding domain-containing protein, partial [Planctomycetota bacterium]|nr:SEC-C metal-binding domain-containing protein [Planctomycetota bacterium]